MSELEARAVAEALGGAAWSVGGNLWVVRFDRSDGSFAVLADGICAVYRNMDDWDKGVASSMVGLGR